MGKAHTLKKNVHPRQVATRGCRAMVPGPPEARNLYASGGQGDNHLMATKKAVRRFSGARVFWAPRVIAMRDAMGLSQRVFAKLVGVSVKTLQNWEQGRRQPSGPAAVLLTVLLTDPDAVLRAVR